MQMIRMTGFTCPSKRWFLVCLFPLFAAQNLIFLFQTSKVYSTQELSYTSMAPLRGQHAGGSDLKRNHNDRGRFAVAYIIAGCSRTSCMGYILNALAASQVLQYHNSTADVVFKVRMASRINDTRLPVQQEEWLLKSGIKLAYLPKVLADNFGTATMEKFRVLEMVEYDRVYFLDSDVLPLCNIDYHLEASYNGRLQPYVGVQGGVAPINAGNFIVTPKRGLFKQVMDIVHRHQNTSKRFDRVTGWGHKLAEKDPWIGSKRRGLNWTMIGAQIDQGVLYHWMKYEMLNWSHWRKRGGEVHTWQEVPSSWPSKNVSNVFEVSNDTFITLTKKFRPFRKGCGMLLGRSRIERFPPFIDSFHFAGPKKPWLQPINATLIPSSLNSTLGAQDVWRYWLGLANRTFRLELPPIMNILAGSPLGEFNRSDYDQLLRPEIELPVPSSELR
jgi:hypothetical protein